jgi:hypothetical protein
MASGLPPPPVNDKPGSFTWMEWYRQLRNYVSTSGNIPWYIINFSGSNITDIAARDHENLQGLQGGTAGEHNHLTNAQLAGIGVGTHNSLTSIQGGSATERYHLSAQQYNGISNSLNVVTTTSGIVLPTTPTVFTPAVTSVLSNGISYNAGTGEMTFTNGGTYTLVLTLNTSASSGNRKVYFYAEINTGSGYAISRYSARSHELTPSTEDQIIFTSTNYFSPGTKTRHYIWASSNTITLNSTDVPGTTTGTVTIPAHRLLWSGAL